eukprot:gene17727-21137_t
MRSSQKASSFFPIHDPALDEEDEFSQQFRERTQRTQPGKTGMYVFAHHLNYSAVNPKTHEQIDILSDLSFYLKPKEMTLILGSPGCGKSALFKVLAGRVKDKHVSGTLLFNGHPIDHQSHHRDIAFVTQEDSHFPLLTVKETFKFALDTQRPEGLSKADQKERIEGCMNSLGLTDQQNTLVGDEFVRGISGGQKKRVTIGVNVIKGSNLILMDEPTTGLDSSTSLEIITSLRKIVNVIETPALVTLLQPSAPLTSLFDNLMILSEGRIVYFGPLADALDYFENLGFVCPKHSNPSEFFQEIVEDPDRYSYVHPPRYQTPDDFVRAYRDSEIYNNMVRTMDNTPNGIMGNHDPSTLKDASGMPTYSVPWYKQIYYNVMRGNRMLLRNLPSATIRIIKGIIMGFVIGTLFWRLKHDQKGGQDRFGLLFFTMTFIIFSSFGAIQQFYTSRNLFYAQRSQKMYNTFSFYIASILCDAPAAAIEIVIFGSLVYWLCALRASFMRFTYFLSILLLTDFLSLGLVKMIASMSPTVEMANVFASAIMGTFMLMSGFMATRNVIKGWWIWLYYISPYTWAFQGLAINEFAEQPYHCRAVELVPPMGYPGLQVPTSEGGYGGSQVCPNTRGEDFLRQNGMHTNYGFRWPCLVILIAYAVGFYVIGYFALRHFNFVEKPKVAKGTISSTAPDPTTKVGVMSLRQRLRRHRDHDRNHIPELDQLSMRKQWQQKLSENQRAAPNPYAHPPPGVMMSQQQPVQPPSYVQPPVDPNYVSLRKSSSTRASLRSSNISGLAFSQDNRAVGGNGDSGSSNTGCYLEFKDLCYSVDAKKKNTESGRKEKVRLPLLNNVSGFATPGKMLALMGPSGAGKSTLLDVLAGRKTGGHTTGTILVDGRPKDRYFNRIAAYVEQQDILPPTQTVREAIRFSAECRLRKTLSAQKKDSYVDKILEVLNLQKIQNNRIGVLGAGISLSQRKRVNIGVELASDPQLIFLDEPTSGLDSGAAFKVINVVSRIAKKLNRTVICTIHQPSSAIFEQFDQLLLLKKGGETIYFGDLGFQSETVLQYCEQYGMHIKPHYNPADFILEIADENKMVPMGPQGEMVEFDGVKEYKKSHMYITTNAALDAGVAPKDMPPPVFKSTYPGTWATQFSCLMKRAWLSRIRRPSTIVSNIVRSLFLSIVLGTLFLRLKHEQLDARNRVSMLFFSFLFGGMAAIGTIPTTCLERSVYYREKSAGFYHVSAYMLSYILSGYPFLMITALVYIIPLYFLGHLDTSPIGKFFYCLFIFIMTYLVFDSMAFMLAVLLPNDVVATVICGVVLSMWSLFAGFMISRPNMPKGWLWMHYADFVRYPLEAAVTNEFADTQFYCTNNKDAIPVPVDDGTIRYYCPVTDGDRFVESYGFHRYMRYIDIGIIFGFFAFFLIIAFLALKFIRWQVR